MNILILGNGFDLAHGLPTSYIDFLNFCQNYNSYNNYFQHDNLNQRFNAIIYDNLWLSCFNNILQLTPNKNSTWIDFENTIYELLFMFSNTNSNNTLKFPYKYNDNLHPFSRVNIKIDSKQSILAEILIIKGWDHITICNGGKTENLIIKDVRSVCLKLYKELRDFVDLFELYCLYIIKNKQLIDFTINESYFWSDIRQQKRFDPTKNWLINFNYTNLFSKYQNRKIIFSDNYIYPHGSIR
jgi:hypothetical protein